jgi:hypothetical protein
MNQLHHLEITTMQIGNRKLPEHIEIKIGNKNYIIAFLNGGSRTFTTRIKNFNELVSNNINKEFILFRDVREKKVTGKVAKAEIDKLNASKNGKFLIMEYYDKLILDIIYQFILDIHNRDIDIDIKTGIAYIFKYYHNYWLVKLFK